MVTKLANLDCIEFPCHLMKFSQRDLEKCQSIEFSDSSQASFGDTIYAKVESKEDMDCNLVLASHE